MRTLAKLLCLAVLAPTVAWAEPSPSPQPDKLRDALTEMVVSVTKTVGDSKDFLVAEAPGYAKDYLAWELVKASIWMWVFIVLTLAILGLSISMLCTGDREFKHIGGWFVFFTVILVGITTSHVLDVIKIKTAPKVVLVEYAKSLVK